MSKTTLPLKINEKISLAITGLTHNGEGVGKWHGFAVFVPGALPGETVSVQVTEIKKNYARACLLQLDTKSPSRVEPLCKYHSTCGGCRLQHVDYQEHLHLKTNLVRDNISRIAGLDNVTIHETTGMEHPWNYRNKVHFHIKDTPLGIRLGFYQEGTHRLISLFDQNDQENPDCLLVDKELNLIAGGAQDLLNQLKSKAPNNGFFKHLVLRKAFFTGEIMVILVTGSQKWPGEELFTKALLKLFPQITSLVRNINDKPGPVMGKHNYLLHGKEHITDRLGNLSIMISPHSFYQVNPIQTEKLYQKVLEYANLNNSTLPLIVDAYSGTGTIALYLAGQKKAGRVIGLEVIPDAVEDSKKNALINKIDNIEFYQGKVEELLPKIVDKDLKPDILILDPPRQGCAPEVLQTAAAVKIPTIIYVSCNPATLARDLGRLSQMGYRANEVQPIDMFPWTVHVECVVSMSRM